MKYKIEPTDAQVKLGIDDLEPNELDMAYRRGFSDAKLEDTDLYEACKEALRKLSYVCSEHILVKQASNKLEQVLAKK